MRRRLLLPLALGALMTSALAAAPVRAEPVAPADRAAVQAVLDRVAQAWNMHDMDAYVADMTPDVDWVNVVGMHWRGREPCAAPTPPCTSACSPTAGSPSWARRRCASWRPA